MRYILTTSTTMELHPVHKLIKMFSF